jgi:hypothetical protein
MAVFRGGAISANPSGTVVIEGNLTVHGNLRVDGMVDLSDRAYLMGGAHFTQSYVLWFPPEGHYISGFTPATQ